MRALSRSRASFLARQADVGKATRLASWSWSVNHGVYVCINTWLFDKIGVISVSINGSLLISINYLLVIICPDVQIVPQIISKRIKSHHNLVIAD